MIFLELIIIGLLTVVLFQRQIKLSTLKSIEGKMASQEDRLKAISARITEVLNMLAELKTNNPDIEDEITEIETKLAPAGQPETPPEG